MTYLLLIMVGALIATYTIVFLLEKEMPKALENHKKRWEEEKKRREKFEKAKLKEK